MKECRRKIKRNKAEREGEEREGNDEGRDKGEGRGGKGTEERLTRLRVANQTA